MFVGHFGIGFGGKWKARKVSLGTLFLASQFIDLLWPSLLLVGLESVRIAPGATRLTSLDFEHYPISHSLLSVLLWALLFAGVYFLLRRSARGAFVCGLLVVSHWVLDLVTHRPDLQLAPMSDLRVGMGLWNNPAAAITTELLLFAGGVFLYERSTRASDRSGVIGLWALVAFLLVAYLANLFGSPPPSMEAIAWVSPAQWILIVWAYWLDRHREPRSL
jgi:membrane-bound metal-dependent hydrolase YbcI (DUF457 family)